ncbi:MAG: guanylate kinase [Bacteroidia bacterium]|nr:guanylate kinase [Bacteroidia bacterium]
MRDFKGKLIIFSAPSGSGKTTIIHRILEKGVNLGFSVSCCSRTKRENETDGVDYYFITAREFRRRIKNNEFLEWEEVYKDSYYGTLKSEVERIWNQGKHVVFDVDVKGGLNIKKYYGEKALSIFIKPPSLQVLADRLDIRGTETPESLKKRLQKAEYEMSFAKDFDVIIINDILEKAVEETFDVISRFINEF